MIGSNLDALFEEALSSAQKELSELPLEKWRSAGFIKSHSDLLGSHTVVTYPPLDSLQPIDGKEVLGSLSLNSPIDLYVHFPFCEYPCKFCPYTTLSVRDSRMERYIAALKIEISTWSQKMKESGAVVRSIYFGGGTPLALPLNVLEDILTTMRESFTFSKALEFCVETSPPATIRSDAKEKLMLLKRFRVNRMNIGIQTFDFETLRDSARTFKGHTESDEENAVKILLDSGISNINVDMIQDLPLNSHSTIGRLRHDLTKLGNLKPAHVTWYNLRLRPETPYANQTIKLPNLEESILSRLTIWNFFEKLGYQILEGDRFARNALFEDNFRKTRGSMDTTLIGIGVSSYSHTPDVFFQNSRVIGGNMRTSSLLATVDYIKRIESKGNAISFGLELSLDERVAGKIALGLKKGIILSDLEKIASKNLLAKSYFTQAKKQIEKLIAEGLIETKGEVTQFTRYGMLFENEICQLFYTSKINELAKSRRKNELSPKQSPNHQVNLVEGA